MNRIRIFKASCYLGQPMKHSIVTLMGLIVIVGAVSAVGCSLCCAPNDYDYPTYGGKHQRVNPAYGRVGSVFSDPNASISGPAADSNLSPRTSLPDDDGEGLESIIPYNDSPDILPSPTEDGSDTTAQRLMKRSPLRSGLSSWK